MPSCKTKPCSYSLKKLSKIQNKQPRFATLENINLGPPKRIFRPPSGPRIPAWNRRSSELHSTAQHVGWGHISNPSPAWANFAGSTPEWNSFQPSWGSISSNRGWHLPVIFKNVQFQEVDSHKYLGLLFHSSLYWHSHILSLHQGFMLQYILTVLDLFQIWCLDLLFCRFTNH